MPEAPGAAAPPSVLAEPATTQTSADPAPPVAATSPTQAAAAQLPQRPVDQAPVAGLSPASEPGAPAQDAARILLRANADAWLMVKDRSGAVLLNRTLKAGETWPVPLRADLLLTTGNAGGTEIIVDGATIPSLGGSGAVRRDLLLDPDQIKNGRLAGSAVPPLASARPRQ